MSTEMIELQTRITSLEKRFNTLLQLLENTPTANFTCNKLGTKQTFKDLSPKNETTSSETHI